MKVVVIVRLVAAVVKALASAKQAYLEAREPDSDGGKKITKAEWLAIADAAWSTKLRRVSVKILKQL